MQVVTISELLEISKESTNAGRIDNHS